MRVWWLGHGPGLLVEPHTWDLFDGSIACHLQLRLCIVRSALPALASVSFTLFGVFGRDVGLGSLFGR